MLVEEAVGHGLGREGVPRRRVEADIAVVAEDAAAEDDRRNVAFAGGPQAHQEADRPGGQVVLVGMLDDGRVEQGRRLDGVLHREVRAEQQLTVAGDLEIGPERHDDGAVVRQEDRLDVPMSRGEVREHLGQELGHVLLVQPHDPAEDRPDARRIVRVEQSRDHALVVRPEHFRATNDVQSRSLAVVVLRSGELVS